MRLEYFTTNDDFPFFIQFGRHEGSMFVHEHKDFSEFVVVMEGSATHIIDDEEYQISKGDVFVINPGVCHGYKNVNQFKICNIMYRSEYIFRDNSDLYFSEGFNTLFNSDSPISNKNFKGRLHLSEEDLESISNILKRMSEEYTLRRTGYSTWLCAEFVKLAVELSRKYETYEDKVDKHMFGIARVAADIEKNYSKDITVGSMAELAGMSLRHFTRLFTLTYGMPPIKYLEKVRMNKAKLMLRSSSKTITEIAYDCGFADNNYFARRFKTLYGMTPSVFRTM
ncbi:MAG: helix-turn-helix domain-containing protein [Lachnospiraceae bacterium]